MRSNGRFRRPQPMSRRKRALRAGMAEAWAAFVERSHPDAIPGDTHAQGDAQWVEVERPVGAEVNVSTETSGGEDASTV